MDDLGPDDTLDWNAVRAFAAIARAGTLTAAARRLGVSQPTLGRHLDGLEARLGATLFVRGRGGMVPTDAGTALLERAEAMTREADALLRQASGRREAPTGDVRVTASRVVAFHLLPAVTARLAMEEPGIRLDIVATDEIANLLARDADLALRMVRPTQPDVIARKLGELRMGAFASAAYLDGTDAPSRIVSTDDLRAHRLVGYDRSTVIIDGMRALGMPADRTLFAVRTDDQLVYQRLVMAGAGIGFLPRLVGEREGLVPVPLPADPPPLPVWLAAHRDLRTSAAVRRVADTANAIIGTALK
jgi:DNA-binding transcriptional LysR family regulator